MVEKRCLRCARASARLPDLEMLSKVSSVFESLSERFEWVWL